MIRTTRNPMLGSASFWTQDLSILGFKTKTLSELVSDMFKNGEQGFFYDPNDLSTMFQDAAGTVPVATAGQPVGLMLDKSKGLALGAENIPLPLNFANWVRTVAVTSYTNNSFTVSAGGGVIYPFSTTQGRTYILKIKGTTSSAPLTVRNGSGTSGQCVIPTGAFDVTIISPALFNDAPGLYLSTYSGTVTIESISMKQLTGNHAYQTNSASRPILRQNAITGAYYLEFDGSDDFLQTANINFTGTDKVSLFAGVRKLSDTASGILAELSNSTLTNNSAFHIEAPSGMLTNNYGFASKVTIRQIAQTSASYPSPNSAVLVGIGTISTDTALLRVNGIQSVSSAGDQGSGNYGNYPLYIGRRGGTTLLFNGHIYNLIGIGRLTSDSETTAIEKEFAKRTGVTLSV